MAQSPAQKAAFQKMLASKGKGKATSSVKTSTKDIPSPFDMKTGVDVGKGPKTIPGVKGKVPTTVKKPVAKKGKGC